MNQYRSWTAEEDEALKQVYAVLSIDELESSFNRTKGAIHKRAQKLGVVKYNLFRSETKRECSTCHELQPWSNFYTDIGSSDGYMYICKTCSKKRMREWELTREYTEERRLARKKVQQAWNQKNPDAVKTHTQNRRSRRKNQFVESVRVIVVYERDKWVCQLCFKPVDATLKYPHPQSKSLDHIVPLSLGGKHSYNNTQLAHLVCNLKKHKKEVF